MVAVREKSKKQARIVEALQLAQQVGMPAWVDVNADKAEGVFKKVPDRDEFGADINESLIVDCILANRRASEHVNRSLHREASRCRRFTSLTGVTSRGVLRGSLHANQSAETQIHQRRAARPQSCQGDLEPFERGYGHAGNAIASCSAFVHGGLCSDRSHHCGCCMSTRPSMVCRKMWSTS